MLPSKILRVRKPKQLPKTLGERAFDYLEKNFIVTIGAASTVFGMCVINAFFFHIEYSPIFDLQAWASIVFSATYVGITLMIMFGILLFLPTFYIAFLSLGNKGKTFDEKNGLRSIRLLAVSNLLFSIVFICIFGVSQYKHELESSLELFTFWRLVGLVVSLFLLSIFFILRKSEMSAKINATWEKFFIFLKAFKFLFLKSKWKVLRRIVRRFFVQLNRCTFQLITRFAKRIFEYGFPIYVLVFLYALCALVFATISEDVSNNNDENAVGKEILRNVLLPSSIVFASSVYLLRAWSDSNLPKIHRFLSCFVAASIPLISSVFAGNPAFIWMRVANATKIGNFYATEITLSKHGCEVLSKNGIDFCNVKIGDSYKICDAYVMSRIGTETFLKLNVSHEAIPPNFPLPSTKKKCEELPVVEVKNGAKGIKNINCEPKSELRKILVPSVDILGLEIASEKENAVFSLSAIDNLMMKKRSICATPPTSDKKIFSFKESDLFEFGQYAIKPEGIKKFEKLAQEIDANKTHITKIDIMGFTDQIGTEQYNLNLSQLRALTVENFLRDKVSKEIDTHVFSSRGFGSTRPKKSDVDCPTTLSLANRKACLADNRRVDVELVY